MLNKKLIAIGLSLILILIASCGGDKDVKKVTAKETSNKTQVSNKRWYSTSQIMRGKKVFKDNCAECHGENGQGLVADWKKQQPDGKFPAPPLNGTAHAWHHSMEILLRTVNNGGIALGGTMPAFKDKLTDVEKEAVLAYVMSLWPDQVYDAWAKRNLK